MLYNLKWLEPGSTFPPTQEKDRIKRYLENEVLFDGEHFGGELRDRNKSYTNEGSISVYRKCAERISQVVGNFEDIISFPVLFNYQRLMSMKMADLVCGEYPTITGSNEQENNAIKVARDNSDFDARLYSTVIDMSRYGDAVWREYIDEDTDERTFTLWDPKEWYPVVRQDGTLRVLYHVLCWRVDKNENMEGTIPNWELHVQIHGTGKQAWGKYESRVYQLDTMGTKILQQLSSETVNTGLDRCAVHHLKAFSTSSTVYGYDDYMPVDSILAEIMARIGQISVILDKHADPNMTGPVTMLSQDPKTGELYLKRGKFFATSQGDNEPKYLTWDGQLTAAFKQLEVLINQLYILSEMGAALLGGEDGSSAAISGTAMRFKMVNPLAKARRISNSLTNPVRQLLSGLAGVDFEGISVFWADGLPDDPRENIENAKLATGKEQMMPLKVAIREFFNRSDKEADEWISAIDEDKQKAAMLAQSSDPSGEDPNHPGPQDGTGVNPNKKGSETGLNNFHGLNNQ